MFLLQFRHRKTTALSAGVLHTVHQPRQQLLNRALSVQLTEALGGEDSSAGQPFCNTWLEGFSLQLPPIAVAIDDSLMALVERCVHHLALI